MLTTVSLFSGIGGFDEGFKRAGFQTSLFCEIDACAAAVLRRRFVGARIAEDIRELNNVPSSVLVTAGFPCQNLSQAGLTHGIHGRDSGLIREVFRLIRHRKPRWLLLENVPFMLRLDKGKAMAYLARKLDDLGFIWAYRVVDTRAFGLPQRRRRVFILASRTEDPREVLLCDNARPADHNAQPESFGFYWTEGIRGLGLAIDAVPALKPGSRISIPSPPAIWLPRSRTVGVPDIRDAERLQGFPVNWTRSLEPNSVLPRRRWALVGNAVSVPVACWIAKRLLKPGSYNRDMSQRLADGDPWGIAGWGWKGMRYRAEVSEWPVESPFRPLHKFLKYPVRRLSARATAGFLRRASASNLRFPPGFLRDIAYHLKRVRAVE